MSDLPYSFGDAKDALNSAKSLQAASEKSLKEAFADYGAAERAYRLALARRIIELRAESTPATVCLDLAKGCQAIADLRYKRDVALGVREAAKQAVYRHAADRKDLEQLVDWSKRRDLAEGYHGAAEPQWSPRAA